MTVLPMTYDAQLFIGGEFADAASGKTLKIINPATGGVIGQLAPMPETTTWTEP